MTVKDKFEMNTLSADNVNSTHKVFWCLGDKAYRSHLACCGRMRLKMDNCRFGCKQAKKEGVKYLLRRRKTYNK